MAAQQCSYVRQAYAFARNTLDGPTVEDLKYFAQVGQVNPKSLVLDDKHGLVGKAMPCNDYFLRAFGVTELDSIAEEIGHYLFHCQPVRYRLGQFTDSNLCAGLLKLKTQRLDRLRNKFAHV
jgi:hypothetical protein